MYHPCTAGSSIPASTQQEAGLQCTTTAADQHWTATAHRVAQPEPSKQRSLSGSSCLCTKPHHAASMPASKYVQQPCAVYPLCQEQQGLPSSASVPRQQWSALCLYSQADKRTACEHHPGLEGCQSGREKSSPAHTARTGAQTWQPHWGTQSREGSPLHWTLSKQSCCMPVQAATQLTDCAALLLGGALLRAVGLLDAQDAQARAPACTAGCAPAIPVQRSRSDR